MAIVRDNIFIPKGNRIILCDWFDWVIYVGTCLLGSTFERGTSDKWTV